MAYVSQELKAALAPKIKAVLKKYNVKGSIAVHHHSSLVLNIKSGTIDFGQAEHRGYLQVNQYWIDDHYTGAAKEFLKEVYAAMMEGNFDYSDPQSDYFSVGWYTDINIGKWNKPYVLEA
jgi:hypothetical protein